jgi:predicted phage terminase large subunit-like protein
LNLQERQGFYQNLFKVAEAKGKQQSSLLLRELCKIDLFFLLKYACKSVGYLFDNDKKAEWVYARCNEVQANPDGYIDLWFREGCKSSVITFGKSIQDILNDPETTIGIFSHTRPIAKGFLRQIKRELEENELLKGLFPDVLYANPHQESPKWSEDDGCIVRRKTNPNAATLEAWGLVDSQPISKHFRIRVYDDVVTKDSVTSPEMINKTTEAWELSLNLGLEGGCQRYVGTFYHYNDTYNTIIARKAAIPRIYPGTKDGTAEGEPVMWTREYLAEKRTSMGPYAFATQILLNPKHDSIEGFDDSWLKFWPASQYKGLNLYIFCDPANEKSKKSDYTVFKLVGVGADKNYYVVTMIRDRLNLIERGNVLFKWHREYNPRGVYYEKYGMQADIQYYETRMNEENYRFRITPVGGSTPKNDRIKRLIPLFEQGKIFLPESCIRTDYEKKSVDLVKIFVNDEYKAFPFSAHDDMLDCLARIQDPDVKTVSPDKAVWVAGASSMEEMINNGIFGKTTEYDPLNYEVSL